MKVRPALPLLVLACFAWAPPAMADGHVLHTQISVDSRIAPGGSVRPPAPPPVTARARAIARGSAADRGVFFFGDDVLPFVDRADATLGRAGSPTFFSPASDVASVRSVSEAARASGFAPSITTAFVRGGEGFGLSFPAKGLPIRRPTAADAGGFPHFLEGGRTAVRTANPNGDSC